MLCAAMTGYYYKTTPEHAVVQRTADRPSDKAKLSKLHARPAGPLDPSLRDIYLNLASIPIGRCGRIRCDTKMGPAPMHEGRKTAGS